MNRSLVLLTLLVALALPGCDSSPTEIVGGPLVFEGTIGQNEDAVFIFELTSSGGIRVEATSLIAEPPLDEGFVASLGVGIGELDDAGACIISVSAALVEGQRLAFGLSERQYCLRVFDNGSIGEGASRTFSILVEPSE